MLALILDPSPLLSSLNFKQKREKTSNERGLFSFLPCIYIKQTEKRDREKGIVSSLSS